MSRGVDVGLEGSTFKGNIILEVAVVLKSGGV
jgi:hypothetical protein